jgi:hypothetical protein
MPRRTERLVLYALASGCNRDDEAFASMETLSQMSGCCEDCVRRILTDFEKRGVVIIMAMAYRLDLSKILKSVPVGTRGK